MKRSQKRKAPRKLEKRVITSSIFGALMGLACFFVMLLLFCAICMALQNPHPLVLPLCFFSVYSSAFLAGLSSVKRNEGKNALWCGLLCGALFCVILWIFISSVNMFSGNSLAQTSTFIWKLLILPSTLLGSFAGLSAKGKKSKKKRRKS